MVASAAQPMAVATPKTIPAASDEADRYGRQRHVPVWQPFVEVGHEGDGHQEGSEQERRWDVPLGSPVATRVRSTRKSKRSPLTKIWNQRRQGFHLFSLPVRMTRKAGPTTRHGELRPDSATGSRFPQLAALSSVTSRIARCTVRDRMRSAATGPPDGVIHLHDTSITRFPSLCSALEESPG